MSDLTSAEKRKLERALGMGSGYVLNFSNRTFAEFFHEGCGIDIYDDKYDYESGSKANRMRAFWEHESNYLVAKVLELLFEEWDEFKEPDSPEKPPEACLKIIQRLKTSAQVPDIDALNSDFNDHNFETLARLVREYVERNEPDKGLDRLHTYVIKYFRMLCMKHGIEADKDKPLHSLAGEYIKILKSKGLIECDMTERILKSTISIMEAFNRVRNNQSFAHDNQVLNYNESLLIFAYITSLIRFIDAVENQKENKSSKEAFLNNDEIPF